MTERIADMRFTVDDVMSFGPCYNWPREVVETFFREADYITLGQVLQSHNSRIRISDKVWLAKKAAPDTILREFYRAEVLYCIRKAKRAAKSDRWDDVDLDVWFMWCEDYIRGIYWGARKFHALCRYTRSIVDRYYGLISMFNALESEYHAIYYPRSQGRLLFPLREPKVVLQHIKKLIKEHDDQIVTYYEHS